MKIMWICNTLIEEISSKLSLEKVKPEPWIIGVYSFMQMQNNLQLLYLYPYKESGVEYKKGNAHFLSYKETVSHKLENEQVNYFKKIVLDYQPDVIHIFGTEYAHSYAATLAAKNCGLIDRVVISIQGLVSIYSNHYTAFLPEDVCKRSSLRDFLRHDNIMQQREKFKKRGYYETLTLSSAKAFIGRTDWDRACIEKNNNNHRYYFCNEILRGSFYHDRWSYEKCEPFSIFVSQSNYPIKGFHLMLIALIDVLKYFPMAKVYTTGPDIIHTTFYQSLKESYYKKYLRRLILDNHLEDHISFLGFLSESEMKQRYLKSNVFVCCSSIENSPNSLGEAMILGVPCISSDVGGVKNLMQHEMDGYIYQADAPYMLSYYIRQVFTDLEKSQEMAANARQKALNTHNIETNNNRLLEIYREIGAYHEQDI